MKAIQAKLLAAKPDGATTVRILRFVIIFTRNINYQIIATIRFVLAYVRRKTSRKFDRIHALFVFLKCATATLIIYQQTILEYFTLVD